MTFPSAGCQTCKIRRIKCDEAQPACQRCIKSGRQCHGTAWFLVHDENSYASGNKKRPRGPRSTATKAPVRCSSRQEPVLHRPLVDLNTKAIMYFSDSYLQTLKGTLSVLKGVTNDFLPIWKSKMECPILDLAVSSVALAVFSRTQQHPPAAVEASEKYHQLLGLQRSAIASLDKGNVDACLIAIFFMGRFEDVVHSPSYPNVNYQDLRRLQSFSHHDGALAILKYWKQHMWSSHPATDIIKYTRRGMIRSATLRNLGLPGWMLDGGSFGERDVELGYDTTTVGIVNVRHRLSILLNDTKGAYLSTNKLTSILEDLDNEAKNLDKRLQDWATLYLSTQGYQRHALPHPRQLPTKYFYSPVVYIYSSPVQASAWILYYATRMLISSTRLKILDAVGSELNTVIHEQRLDCLSTMETMANNLASSLPFSLQRFSAIRDPVLSLEQNSIMINEDDDVKPYLANIIIWPLSLAANLGGVDVKYKLWLRSLLARLGRIAGIALLEVAETTSWPEL